MGADTGREARENIREALTAIKCDYPGSRWNDAEHDPLAQFDALSEAASQAEMMRDAYEEAFLRAGAAQADEAHNVAVQRERAEQAERELAACREALREIEQLADGMAAELAERDNDEGARMVTILASRLGNLSQPAVSGGLLDAIHQDAEWARECLVAGGYVGGRSTRSGDRALTYIERIARTALAVSGDEGKYGPGCERHRGDPHNLCEACWELEPAVSGDGEETCYCGDISVSGWRHKHGCPARKDAYCQSHPSGCPAPVPVDGEATT